MIYREFKGVSYIDFPDEYCLVDIETTGLSPYDSEIIEIGAIKCKGGVMRETFQTLVQPTKNNGIFVPI